jgi:ABC-2 type transport system ATP-binding protein
MDRELCSDRVEMLLERMQLTRFADITLGKYSKGMLQRVGLCQTLLHDPELLVLDEPMSGLDPVGRALVRDLILEQREAGKTVFFSSHILTDVEAICDRVAILVGGELRACGSIKDVVADRENLESVLVGEMTKVVDESALGVL